MNFQATQVRGSGASGIPIPKASFDETQKSARSRGRAGSNNNSNSNSNSTRTKTDSTRARVIQLERERQERRRQMQEYRRNRVAQVKRNEAMGRPGDVDFQNMIDAWRAEKGGYPRPFSELHLGNSKICVAIRTRPVNEMEKKKKQHEAVSCINPRVVVHECKFAVDGITKYLENHEFEFDCTFGPQHNNDHVYHTCVSPLVGQAFSGGKATCFAFGQTGSGKTYTMAGMQERAAQELFNMLNSDKAKPGTTLHMSFFEICGVRCYDLLTHTADAKRAQLPIREDGKGVIHVEGLSVHDLTEVRHMIQAIKDGNKRRKTSKTEVHDMSSRSHAIFQLYLRNSKGKVVGKLSLCDLAGSERGSETKHHNKERRVESAEINKSLLALKECIRALDFGLSHVPYRASKLTMILKDSFGPGSLTTMVSCISPTYAQQNHTLSTLRYTDLIKGKDVSAASFEKHEEPDMPVAAFSAQVPALPEPSAVESEPKAPAANSEVSKPKAQTKPKGQTKPVRKPSLNRKKNPVAASAPAAAPAPAPRSAAASKPSRLKKPQAAVKKVAAIKAKKAAVEKKSVATSKKSSAGQQPAHTSPRKFHWRTSSDGNSNIPSPSLSHSQVFGSKKALSRSGRLHAKNSPAANDFSDLSLDDMMRKSGSPGQKPHNRKHGQRLKPETDMTMHDLIAQAKRNAANRRKSNLGKTPSPTPARVEKLSLQDSEVISKSKSRAAPAASPGPSVTASPFPQSVDSAELASNRPETPDAFRDDTLPQEALLEQEQQLIELHEVHIHEHAKIVEAETHLLESVTGNFDYSIDDYTKTLQAILDQKDALTKALRAKLNAFNEALAKEEAKWS